jgi:hypothetical protein
VLVLLASQLSRLSSDQYQLASLAARPLYIGAAWLVCGVFIVCVWPALRARRELRFFAAGALCSALPLAAAAPSDRLLTFVGLGAMPLLATMLHETLASARAHAGVVPRALRLRDACVIAFALVHLIVDPLLLAPAALWPGLTERSLESVDASVPRDAELDQRAVIVTEVPDSILVSYLAPMRAYKGEAPIGKLYWLVGNTTPTQFERRGANGLRVTAQGGFFSDAWNERNSRFPMHAGDHITLSEMNITVVQVTADGRPRVCDFVFAHPLEAEHYLWLRYDHDRLVPTRPPQTARGALVSTAGG